MNRQAQHLKDNNFVELDEYRNKWWFPLEFKDGKLTDAPEFDYEAHERRLRQLLERKEANRQWSAAPDYF